MKSLKPDKEKSAPNRGAYLGGARSFGQWRRRPPLRASIRVGLEFRGREVKPQHSRIALDLRPELNREVQDRDGARRIFCRQTAPLRLGARAGQRRRQFAETRIVPDQTHAFVRVGEGSRALEQRGEGRVVEAGVLFKLDFASPLGGENLSRLLGSRGAGMDENIRKTVAGGGGRGARPRRPR